MMGCKEHTGGVESSRKELNMATGIVICALLERLLKVAVLAGEHGTEKVCGSDRSITARDTVSLYRHSCSSTFISGEA